MKIQTQRIEDIVKKNILLKMAAPVIGVALIASCGSSSSSESTGAKTRTKNAALDAQLPVPELTGKVTAAGLPIVTTLDGCDIAFKDNTFYPCKPIKQMYGFFMTKDSQYVDIPKLEVSDKTYSEFKLVPPANATGLSFKIEIAETGAFLKAGINYVAAASVTTLPAISTSVPQVPVPVSLGGISSLGHPVVATVDGCDFGFKLNEYFPCKPIKQMYGYFLFADGTSSPIPALAPSDIPVTRFKIVPPANATALTFKVELWGSGIFLKTQIKLTALQPEDVTTTISPATTTTMAPATTTTTTPKDSVTDCVVSYNRDTQFVSFCLPTFAWSYVFEDANKKWISVKGTPQDWESGMASGGTNAVQIPMPAGAVALNIKGRIIDNSNIQAVRIPITNPQTFVKAVRTNGFPPKAAIAGLPNCKVRNEESQFSACKAIRRLSMRYTDATGGYIAPWTVLFPGKSVATLPTPPTNATGLIFHILFPDGSWTEPTSMNFNATIQVPMKDVPGWKTNTTVTTSTTTTTLPPTTTTIARAKCIFTATDSWVSWCKDAIKWRWRTQYIGGVSDWSTTIPSPPQTGTKTNFGILGKRATAVQIEVTFVDKKTSGIVTLFVKTSRTVLLP